MKNFFAGLALLSSVTVFAQSADKLEKLAATISPKDLNDKLSIIAGAGMEGRETATPAQKRAAVYIEDCF
jgi:hypothetical protein